MINIIGGKFKKKKIEVPTSKVRPTSAIKREAIFSIIESYANKNSYNIYKDRCFIDLFAGSGSLGLEAISRGATFAYFYEISNNVIKKLSNNCKKICKKNEFIIYQQNSLMIKKFEIDYPLSVIFIDPPYILNPFEDILKKILISNILEDKSIIIIETDKKKIIKIPNQLKIIKEKIYGKTKLIFLKN